MAPDLWSLYALMKMSRLFEETVTQLWQEGLISGEMHLGTGEEAIVAGVLDHVQEGDALALDHRATPALLMRGVDPVLILRELLGHEEGLCRGQGGHMHLFSHEHLAASSGIVGASGPAAAGFALAGQYLRPRAIAVAFFGEGAMNQGMLLEALNLAAVWRLPVLFVCKDDNWSITSDSSQLTGGNLCQRVEGLGVPYTVVDGTDVAAVWEAAGESIERIRDGHGPSFLHASCVHLEAHFLGYQLVRAARKPLQEVPRIARPLLKSFFRPGGASLRMRRQGLREVLSALLTTHRDPRRSTANDPLIRARRALVSEPQRLRELEEDVEREIAAILSAVVEEGSG